MTQKPQESSERRNKRSRRIRRKLSKIYDHLVDKAAFVHKIVLGVDGKLNDSYCDVLLHRKSQGIFHPGSLYSRRLSGRFKPTGNPVVILHGPTKHFRNVPLLWITMHSGRTPLTAAQVILLIRQITEVTPPEVRVSQLEFTF